MYSQPQHVIFLAERAGSAFRGEVVDGLSFETIIRTSTTYTTEANARMAARTLWSERQVRLARASGMLCEVA